MSFCRLQRSPAITLITRCSSRTKCGKDKQSHNLLDLEKCYLEVKDKFVKWNDEREEKLVLLEFKVTFFLESEPCFCSAFIYCSGVIMTAL